MSALVPMVAAWLAFASASPQAPPASALGNEPLPSGSFAWQPELSPSGPVLILVDIGEQQAYVYRNGVRIARSSVSTDDPVGATPSGVFTILQKHREPPPNRYNEPSRPAVQRLTWSGLALHAGKSPGDPAAHGYVRLPYDFSERLFEVTGTGATVVIRNGAADPQPSTQAPFESSSSARGSSESGWTWRPERSPAGPMTIVLSTSEGIAVVLRNGVEIGRSPVQVLAAGDAATHVYMLLSGQAYRESRIVPGRPALNWVAVGEGTQPVDLGGERTARVAVPPPFAQRAYDALEPGTTVVVTAQALSADSPGAPLTILRADQ
jgi:lipoprotein-anchoring transpeptidase ErfK/SrfK